jgi:hypothetical protein
MMHPDLCSIRASGAGGLSDDDGDGDGGQDRGEVEEEER